MTVRAKAFWVKDNGDKDLVGEADWTYADACTVHATGTFPIDGVPYRVLQTEPTHPPLVGDFDLYVEPLDEDATTDQGGDVGIEGTGEDESAAPSEAHLDFLLEQVGAALDTQWDYFQHLDQRIRFIITAILGVVTLTVTLSIGKNPAEGLGPFLLTAPSRQALLIAGGLLLLTLFFAGAAYILERFDRPPRPREFVDLYLHRATADTKLTLLGTLADAYTTNKRDLSVVKWLTFAAMIGGVAATAVAIFGLGSAIARA